MRLDWVGGRNVAGFGWWQKCRWIGMVAEMQLVWASTKNAGGMG